MSAVADVLRQYAGLYIERIQEGLNETGAIASGELGESIAIDLKPSSFNITMLDYWVYVDEGRKAGKFPPISAIEKWLTYPAVQDRLTFGREDLFDDSNRSSLAYVIARKIANKGTKGNEFVTNVVESDLTDEMVNALADATADDIVALI